MSQEQFASLIIYLKAENIPQKMFFSAKKESQFGITNAPESNPG